MFFEHRAFILPKDIDHPNECQDAYACDASRGVAAIADGVSNSLFASSWAKLLVDGVVADLPDLSDAPSLPPWLAGLREKWLEPIDVENLPWHQKPKFKNGASSTLLWVELYADRADSPRSSAFDLYCYAIGDSCLFHVRGKKVLQSFPLDESKQFEADPYVIASVDNNTDHLLTFETLETACIEGDLLVLCTDAVAAWAIARMEDGDPVNWHSYWKKTDDQWREEIVELRHSQRIRYDDSTLLILRIGAEKPVERPMRAVPVE